MNNPHKAVFVASNPPPAAGMTVGIEFITSLEIRAEMERDGYTRAQLLGTFQHPNRDGSDWTIRLYRAADVLVFETNAGPVWSGTEDFHSIVADYGVAIGPELL